MVKLQDGQKWECRDGTRTVLTYRPDDDWYEADTGYVYCDDTEVEDNHKVFPGRYDDHDCDLMVLIE